MRRLFSEYAYSSLLLQQQNSHFIQHRRRVVRTSPTLYWLSLNAGRSTFLIAALYNQTPNITEFEIICRYWYKLNRVFEVQVPINYPILPI